MKFFVFASYFLFQVSQMILEDTGFFLAALKSHYLKTKTDTGVHSLEGVVFSFLASTALASPSTPNATAIILRAMLGAYCISKNVLRFTKVFPPTITLTEACAFFSIRYPYSLHKGTLLWMQSSNVYTSLSVHSSRMMTTWAWRKASSTLVQKETLRSKGDTRSRVSVNRSFRYSSACLLSNRFMLISVCIPNTSPLVKMGIRL